MVDKNSQNKFIVRPAKSEEAEELTKLAFISKGYWGYPPEWLEAWRDDLTVTPELIQNAMTHVVELDKKIVAFSVIQPKYAVNLLMFFIDPDYMGKGIGKLLFKTIKQDALSRGLTHLTLESDPNAESFYEKMGAIKIEEKESTVIPGRKFPILRFELKK